MTAVELPLLQRQACLDGGREGSAYGIDEWLELKYLAIGGVDGT